MTLGGRLVAGIAGSAAVHGTLVFLLLVGGLTPPKPPPKDETVELTVVDTPPPKPPAPPPPTPEPPKPKPPPRLRVRPPPRVKKAPPPKLPPPSNQPPPPKAPPKPVPLVTGISMSSTVAEGQGSGMVVGVGNTVYGAPSDTAADPSKVKAYQGADHYVPPERVSTLPEVAHEVKASYPPEARAAGIEGKVRLKLVIDSGGKVVSVKVVSGLGHGLDQAAAKAMRRFRFKPATVDGQSVSTTIIYTYTFLLD